jgi:hypothetical protein
MGTYVYLWPMGNHDIASINNASGMKSEAVSQIAVTLITCVRRLSSAYDVQLARTVHMHTVSGCGSLKNSRNATVLVLSKRWRRLRHHVARDASAQTHTRAHTAHKHSHMRMWTQIYTHIHRHRHVHMHMHIYIHICIHIHIHTLNVQALGANVGLHLCAYAHAIVSAVVHVCGCARSCVWSGVRGPNGQCHVVLW